MNSIRKLANVSTPSTHAAAPNNIVQLTSVASRCCSDSIDSFSTKPPTTRLDSLNSSKFDVVSNLVITSGMRISGKLWGDVVDDDFDPLVTNTQGTIVEYDKSELVVTNTKTQKKKKEIGPRKL